MVAPACREQVCGVQACQGTWAQGVQGVQGVRRAGPGTAGEEGFRLASEVALILHQT